MAATQPPSLVSPDWLSRNLNEPDVKVLDASWYLGVMKRDAKAEFAAERIPGSQFFDIDGVSAVGGDLPHMLPTEGQFGAAMSALGISNSDTVLLYDRWAKQTALAP